jgi:hypothetical protein
MRALSNQAWLCLSAVVVACSATGPAPSTPPRKSVPNEPSPAVEKAAAPVETGPIQVLYRDRWAGLDAVLLGVDGQQRRAYLALKQHDRYVIDTVDLDGGQRLDRWEANTAAAERLSEYDLHFHPLSGSRHDDLKRLGSMMSGWSVRHARAGSGWPIADVSSDASTVLFSAAPTGNHPGDWLYLYDVDRRRSVRIDRGVIASYDVKLSPDGKHLAWRGCTGRRPCRYALYVSSTRDAAQGRRPHRVAVASPTRPLWSNGEVFALATPRGKERCVVRVDPKRKRARPIACDQHLAQLVLSDDGRHLLYAKRKRHGSSSRSTLVWHPTDSAPTATRTIDGISHISVSDSGLVLADRPGGLLALDMNGASSRLLPADQGFVFVPNIHWLDGDRAVLLRKRFDGAELALVELDVKEFLSQANP